MKACRHAITPRSAYFNHRGRQGISINMINCERFGQPHRKINAQNYMHWIWMQTGGVYITNERTKAILISQYPKLSDFDVYYGSSAMVVWWVLSEMTIYKNVSMHNTLYLHRRIYDLQIAHSAAHNFHFHSEERSTKNKLCIKIMFYRRAAICTRPINACCRFADSLAAAAVNPT